MRIRGNSSFVIRINARTVILNCIAILAFFIILGILNCRLSFAGTVTLEPGKSYDISKYGINTTLNISKDGKYTFTGSSNTVIIDVHATNATIVLDNAKILPGINANTGKDASAISISEKKGNVTTIITAAGSTNEVGGYRCPTINKPGTSTQLIFDTEDSSNCGYLYAHNDTPYCPAIGKKGGKKGFSHDWTGNMYFKGGKIKVESIAQAAAIGGGESVAVDGIYISGGDITATASGGAGIGSGAGANVYNINISGGTVKAYGGYRSAGIGSGDGDHSCIKSIRISGGDIYAKGGRCGAGIGGGYRSGAAKITITGGNIEAHGGSEGAAGIGSGGGKSGTSSTTIDISGGNILAVGSDDCAGIGAHEYFDKDLTINISGGKVVAKAGKKGYGIGGGGYPDTYTWKRPNVNINISGGTITTYAGKDKASIGRSKTKSSVKITLTGGNIKCTSEYSSYHDIMGATAKDANGEAVKLRIVRCLGSMEGDTITSLSVKYGLKDVETLNNYMYTSEEGVNIPYSQLYAYLPESTPYISWLKLNRNGVIVDYSQLIFDKKINDNYYTSIQEVKLDANLDGTDLSGSNGSVNVILGKTETFMYKICPASVEGYVPTGYYALPVDSTLVFTQNNGTLQWVKGDVYHNNIKYIEKNIWVNNDPKLSLFAQWRPITYSIKYDSNAPKSCTVSGEMPNTLDIKYDTNVTLLENAYSIDGCDFKGWNTKADGSGTAYSDEAKVKNLTTKDGDVVTLYAQWEPKKYEVSLTSSESAVPVKQQFTYCVEAQLKKLSDTGFIAPSGKFFAGWRVKGVAGSRIYADEETVMNLCGYDDTTSKLVGFTLEANWIDNVDIKVYASYGNTAFTDAELALINDNLEVSMNNDGEGYYSFNNSGGSPISQGKYKLCIKNGSKYEYTGIDVNVDGKADMYYLNYYNIDVTGQAATHFKTAAHYTVNSSDIADKPGIVLNRDGVEYILRGTELAITAGELKEGYHFVKWISNKIDPSVSDWSNSHSFTCNVNGDMELIAVTKLNHYSINKFDSNCPSGCSSSITGLEPESIANIGYGEEYALPDCNWNLEGYAFVDWTAIEIDENNQQFKKTEHLKPGTHSDVLATQNGHNVKLVANWKPIKYTVDFNSALPLSEQSLASEGIVCTYDSLLRIPSINEVNWNIEDYHFVGWNSDSAGNGTWYESGGVYKNLSTDEGAHVVIWAIWEQDEHKDDKKGSGTDTGDSSELMMYVIVAFIALIGLRYVYKR